MQSQQNGFQCPAEKTVFSVKAPPHQRERKREKTFQRKHKYNGLVGDELKKAKLPSIEHCQEIRIM